MGFSGGGSNVTKAHTHDSTIVQDGGSLAANVTQFGLSAGSILYSDGSNIQELAVGSASDALTVNAGATAPEWAAAGGSTWTNEGSSTSTTATPYLEVSGLSDQDVYQVIYSVSNNASGTGMNFTCEINGIVTDSYNMLISAFSDGDTGTSAYQEKKFLLSNSGASGTAHSGVFYLYKGDSNFTADARAYLNVMGEDVMFQTDTDIKPITRVMTSGNNESITGAVTSIRLLYRVQGTDVTQNCIGSMQVNSLSY
jgi:hypothetical protein